MRREAQLRRSVAHSHAPTTRDELGATQALSPHAYGDGRGESSLWWCAARDLTSGPRVCCCLLVAAASLVRPSAEQVELAFQLPTVGWLEGPASTVNPGPIRLEEFRHGRA
jgi:hypothetical protein